MSDASIMQVLTESAGGDLQQPHGVSDGLACNSCRKAKLRCSRDKPDCSYCKKTGADCVYESKRVKPGIKSGAIENIHRRIGNPHWPYQLLYVLPMADDLERRLSEQESTVRDCHHNTLQSTGIACDTARESAASSILALLAKELPKLVPHPSRTGDATPLSDGRSNKRKRMMNEGIMSPTTWDAHEAPPLPEHQIMEAIIAAYFSHVHPWIPMIHQARFLQRLDDRSQHGQISLLLQAMVLAASKFVSGAQKRGAQEARRYIVCTAMETLSLESLQALTILAFDDIGGGKAVKAWSIIGSMTRTVEYMGLAQEQEEGELRPFCQPYACLQETDDWTEVEERRRVFWNVFLLDRFCSVTMGWNTSLTSDDVYRRLPCDGHLWRKQSPVLTPYFGIWDKSKGRIGNPIGSISHFASPIHEPPTIESARHGPIGPAQSIDVGQKIEADMSTVGAFAYNIEATESMSRVMSYFLQQKVNVRDQEEISSWLTRFKELDLRLVHWKMLLPQKWKANPNLTRHVPLMDPNLTTAHVTHNASMILLHQLIAYPPIQWGFRYRLPSTCSAEACYTAGVEIATITEKYLGKSSALSPVGCQFAFCLFTAARALLAHWRYTHGNHLASEFWSLMQSLEEMSKRWIGLSEVLPGEDDLFIQYARRLRRLHELCLTDHDYQLNVMDYTNDINHRYGNAMSSPSVQAWSNVAVTAPLTNVELPLLSPDFNTIPMPDQAFMDMDRIIAFDDGSMFASSFDLGANAW